MKRIIQLICLLCLSVKLIAQKENVLWVKQFGASSFDMTKSIKTDKDSNVYVFGQFEDVVDLDPEGGVYNFTAKGYSDLFLVKMNARGELVWAVSMGGVRIDIASSFTLDKNSNCYLVGSFEGVMDADPSNATFNLTSKGGRDAYIIKLDVNGKFQWAKSVGSSSYDNAVGVCTDVYDNCYVTGDFQDSVDADPGIDIDKLYARGNADIFLLKLDTYGNYQWARSVGGKIADYGIGVHIDRQENILTTGHFRDTVDFDPSFVGVDLVINTPPPFTVPPTLDYNTFIWKLDKNGHHIWAKQFDGTAETTSTGIKLDSVDNIYIGGTFKGNSDFDPSAATQQLTSMGFDGFIAKLDMHGNYVWARQFTGTGDCTLSAIGLDTAANIYSTGNFTYTKDFDPGPGISNLITNGINNNTFISKLDKDGNYVWCKQFRQGPSGGATIFVDKNATVYTGGGFGQIVNFHPDSAFMLTSAGMFDAFVHKMSQCPGTQFIDSFYTDCDSLVIHDTVYKVSGVFSDTITNDLGCDTISTLHVTIHKAEIEGSIKHVSCKETNDGELTLNNTGVFYQLYPGQVTNTSGVFTQLSPNIYTVQLTDSNGCQAKKIFNVQQLSCCDNLFVPTAFTPNNDLLNDEFSFYNAYGIELKDFQIRNRFGEMVFTTHVLQDAWNGNFKGQKAEMGTYYYFIRYICLSSGKEYVKKGDIILIR